MMTDLKPFLPGTTIGILGGGQLGRMLALAAARLGMHSHIFCPDPLSPAFAVTPLRTVAAYDDQAALQAFADAVDVITYEFENVPLATAEFLAQRKPLAPGARPLGIAQDRVAEKTFLSETGIAVAPWHAVETKKELTAALADIGAPAVLKTARLGYDGKGQRMIKTLDDAPAAHAELAASSLVAEAFVPFDREISVVVARSAAGEVRAFDPAENVHQHHILHTSTVPATIDAETAQTACSIAEQIATALDYVGVLGVEFFVTRENGSETLLVNEIAPRVHNSGHWTEAVCVTDQFEQHIRAILNWPLGDPARLADAQMRNLIGAEAEDPLQWLDANSQIHLYGKAEARPGRKMGHVNRIANRVRR